MDILGVGPLELLFIFLIALIFLGPTDMVKAGRTLGKFMRQIVTSDAWREISRLRTLPNQLMREAGLEEEMRELQQIQKEIKSEVPQLLDIDQASATDDLRHAIDVTNRDNLSDLSAWISAPVAAPNASLHSNEKTKLTSQFDAPTTWQGDSTELTPAGQGAETTADKPETPAMKQSGAED